MAYKNKVYVSMDADNDLHYYYLMKANIRMTSSAPEIG